MLRRNYLILCLKISLFTYIVRCHKSFGINLSGGGGAHCFLRGVINTPTVFYADYIYSPLLVVINTSLADDLQR